MQAGLVTDYPWVWLMVETTEQVPKPHPNAFFAFFWVFVFLLATQVPGALIVFSLLLWNAWVSGDFSDYFSRVQDDAFQQSAEYAKILAPGLAVSQLLTILVGVLVLRLAAGGDWSRRIALHVPAWPQFLMAMGFFPGLVFLGEGIDRVVRPYLPQIIPMENAIAGFSHWPWRLGVLIIGFGPGIGEELWCRGFLGRGLLANHGTVKGVLLTSVLFGLMHIEPRQIAYATVLGLLLHLSYIWTRSLLVPMVLHVMNNSLSMLQFAKDGPDMSFLVSMQSASVESPIMFFGGLSGLLVLCGLALNLCRPSVIATRVGTDPWCVPFATVSLPPKDSGSGLKYPFPGLASWMSFVLGVILFAACLYFALAWK